jgi:two-component system, OmpR family, sensor kinase
VAVSLPLRWRLTLGFAAGMALVLVALGVFVHARLRADLTESIDEGLLSQAQFVTTAAERGEPLSSNGAIVDADDALAQVVDASGDVVGFASPLASDPFLTPGALDAVHGEAFSETWAPSVALPVRVLAVPRPDGSFVVVARTLDDRNEALTRLARQLLIGGTAALALSTALGWALSGAALRPVERLRREADAISLSEPERRLSVPAPRDELRALAETLNTMLERLQTSMQTERDFLDRASHELRTPLTVLKAELELALARPRTPAELEAALRASSQEVETLVRLAEDLLVLSRERDGQLPVRKEPIDVDDLLARLATGFTTEARSAGVAIHVQVEPGLDLSADPIRLRQAVSNLIVNALQHTPAGGRIDLEARRTGASVSIEVRDSGRGFGAERVDGVPGTGLGLAIVDAIVRGHGGVVEIDAAATGGLVRMVLPGGPEGVEIGPAGASPAVGQPT